MFDAFKNLQFISCFFDGFVIIRLKSYLQERFVIILLLFQINKEQKKQTTHPKLKCNKKLLLLLLLLNSISHKKPQITPLHLQTETNKAH